MSDVNNFIQQIKLGIHSFQLPVAKPLLRQLRITDNNYPGVAMEVIVLVVLQSWII